jgi:hypothetical protein
MAEPSPIAAVGWPTRKAAAAHKLVITRRSTDHFGAPGNLGPSMCGAALEGVVRTVTAQPRGQRPSPEPVLKIAEAFSVDEIEAMVAAGYL